MPTFFFIIPDGSFWDFTSDLAKGDTAYTTLALGAHTDTTYFVRTPIPLLESVFSYNLILLLPLPLPPVHPRPPCPPVLALDLA